MAAITHDVTVTADVYDQGSLTFAVTVDSLRTNRILVIHIANGIAGAPAATSITYAGAALGLRASTLQGAVCRLETWSKKTPAIGTNNVVITWPSNARAAVTATVYYNAAGTVPSVQVAQGTVATPPETEVAAIAGGEADFITVCAHCNRSPAPFLTLLSGQTARSNHQAAVGGPFEIQLATDDRAYALSPQRYLASASSAWVSHGFYNPALKVDHQGRLTSHSPTSGICAGRLPIEQRLYVGEGGRFGPYATVVFGDVQQVDLGLVTLSPNTWYEAKVLPARDGVEGATALYRARFRTNGAGDPVPSPNLVSQVKLTPQAGGDMLVEWAYDPQYHTEAPTQFELRYDFDDSGPFDHDKAADATESYAANQRRYSKTIGPTGTPGRIRVSVRAKGATYDNHDLRTWGAAVAPTGPEKLTETVVLAVTDV